jgi:predicted nucleotidyltransferase
MSWQTVYLSRAVKYAKLLSRVPSVRFVGLNGSLARGCATKKSDIDLLIVTRPNRLYTARFFATMILALTPWRRRRNHVAGKICLNCFLSENHLDIRPEHKGDEQKVAISNLALVPLFDPYGIYDRFFAENIWMNHYITKDSKKSLPNPVMIDKPLKFNDKKQKRTSVGNWFELLQMNYQSKRILRGKKLYDETYVSSDFIKLHPKK